MLVLASTQVFVVFVLVTVLIIYERSYWHRDNGKVSKERVKREKKQLDLGVFIRFGDCVGYVSSRKLGFVCKSVVSRWFMWRVCERLLVNRFRVRYV